MKQDLGSDLKIKAAGGVSSYEDLLEFISAGAERIGTSRSLALFKGHDKMITVNVVSYVSVKGGTEISKIVDETKKAKEEVATKKAEAAKETEQNKVDKKGNKEQKLEPQVEQPKTKKTKKSKKTSGSTY